MEKSKLGLSIGLFCAILYFIGATGNGVLILSLATAYIMLCEKNERLKKTALKALLLSIFFAILIMFANAITISLFVMVQTIANVFVSMNDFHINFRIGSIAGMLSNVIPNIIRVVEVIVFVILGVRAYRKRDIKITAIDKIIDREKNENEVEENDDE